VVIPLRPDGEPRKTNDIDEIYARQVDVVYRVCLSYAKNKADTEDCVSDTFMNLIKANPVFADLEHERAWLIRTAANVCKNYLTHWTRKNLNIDDHESELPAYDNIHDSTESSDVLQAVRGLPEKLKIPVYLFYYEGYTSAEIAEMLNKPDSTIRGHLRDAKILLKSKLKERSLLL
jgi:RNA polymerase sigma-70 factor (ECF subfamily)